jgi:hypothetical protein
MEQSLFYKYVQRYFPQLKKVIELINGRRQPLTYLHKGENAMLELKYAPDNKWESASINSSNVAADVVAQNSELPLKSRSTLSSATGKLPKVGMKKNLMESDINMLNVMIAQGATDADVARKLAADDAACSVGVDEINEYNFLYGLSNGYVGIKDEEGKDNTLLRINFNYLDENTFGATTKNKLTLTDIKSVIAKADGDGNAIIRVMIAKSAFDALRQTDEAKALVANYKGTVYSDVANLPVPSATAFNEAFADDNNGITFQVIDRSVRVEKNGKYTAVKPWNANHLIFICNDVVGSLVYGRLAEQSNPAKNAEYQLVDNYKLISKYSKTDPLIETTAVQAFVAPIIEDVDQIYMLDYSVKK